VKNVQEHSSNPLLVIYKGTLAGTRWPITGDSVTVGRAKDCDIVLLERQVSRHHARIERDSSGFVLRDLGSKNGTFVNGEPVQGRPYRLCDGDEIDVASVLQMGFVAGEATLPLADALIYTEHLQVNAAARQVTRGRAILDPPLSPAQFVLLSLLIEAQGDVVTRDEVIKGVWPEAVGGVSDQALDALVYRLRERLTELDADHNYIVTVRGHGFRYEADPLA
jgi:DNA-binding winged helix-turn-helix (wHTH) protein